MTGFYVTKSDVIDNVQNLKFKTLPQDLRSSYENFCSAVWCKRKSRWKRNCDFTCTMQWCKADINTVRNVRAFEYLKNEICRYWQVNNLNVTNQTETRLFFVRPMHAIKRNVRASGLVSKKKKSKYYVDAAIVPTKTREQAGTDEN